jgi:hypothetical protein
MRKKLSLAIGCCILLACNNNKTADATASTPADTTSAAKVMEPKAAEFADAKYVDMGKKDLEQFANGDIDGWLSSFGDHARFNWSSGDSLVGKAAITSYWKERRTKVIDSISYTNDIWLPIKVNKPQKGPDVAGVWLLGWYQAHVKYKNGKRLVFWVHADNHYDSTDKIDLKVEYIDRAPINKALGK